MKKKFLIYKNKRSVHILVKKFSKITLPVRVDSVTDEYIITIPESFVQQLDLYEDQELTLELYEEGIYIQEA